MDNDEFDQEEILENSECLNCGSKQWTECVLDDSSNVGSCDDCEKKVLH